jgi:phospholipase/lecithinase/hemolysin
MSRIRHLFATVALAGAAFVAQAAPYSSLIVFGDSLSDAGNAAALTATASGPFFPPAPYAGTFSNGPTAAQYLANIYAAPVVLGWPNATGATNFAVGGALTGAGNFNFLVNSPPGLVGFPQLQNTGIAQQIARYNPPSLDAARTLFLLFGGPNDFFYGLAQLQNGLPVDFATLTMAAVTNLSGDIGALAALGAKNILVPKMPDLGLLPDAVSAGVVAQATLTALTNAFNAGLDTAIDVNRAALASSGVNLYEFDTAQFLRDAVSSPPTGITDTTSSCLSGGAAALASNCAGYLFFDGVHPTTFAHQLLAQQFALAAAPLAVPEPSSWALMVAALVLLGLQCRKRS